MLRLLNTAFWGTVFFCSWSFSALADNVAATAPAPQQDAGAPSRDAAPKPSEPKIKDNHYFSLEFGQSTLPQNGCSVSTSNYAGATLSSCNDQASAIRLGAGYAFSDTFGIELSYADYGSSQLGVLNVPGRPPINAGRRDISGFELTAGAFHPRNEKTVLISVDIGLAYTMVHMPDLGMKSSSIGLTFGALAQFKLAQNLDLRVRYKLVSFHDPLGSGGLIQLVTAGTVYYF